MSRELIHGDAKRILTSRESIQRCIIRFRAAPRFPALELASSLNRNWENYEHQKETVVDGTRWTGTP